MLSMGSNEFGFKIPHQKFSISCSSVCAGSCCIGNLVFLLTLLLSLHHFQRELYRIDDVKKLLIEMLGVLIAIILERDFVYSFLLKCY